MNELYTIRGSTKPFLTWCKEFNCRPEVIRSRMSMGIAFEDALLTVDTHRDLVFRFNNEERTFQHWCRLHRINHMTVKGRLRMGWDFESALCSPVHFINKRKKYYEINGEWKSLEELSADYNINQTTITKRLAKGESVMEAVDLVYKERIRAVQAEKPTSAYKLYTLNGETKPLHSWCKVYKVSVEQVQYRLKNGYSLMDALKPGKNTGAFQYNYKGKKVTLADLSKESGIHRYTLYRRIEHEGLSIEEAVTADRPKPERLLFDIGGNRMSLREIGEKYNIDPRVLYSRVAVQKLPIEEAISKPLLNQEIIYSLDGEDLNLKEISEKYGISYSTLRYRVLVKNMPVEEAIIQNEQIPKTYDLAGEWYTIEQLSVRSGVSCRAILGRIERGCSVEQAILKTLPPATATRYNVFGEMLTISEIEAKYKISKAAYRYRLSTGMSAEDAATKKHILVYNVNGKDMKLSEISKLTGIKKCTLYDRLVNKGMSLEEAMSTEDYRKEKRT